METGQNGQARREGHITPADNLHTMVAERVERELIAQVMAECNNVQTKAAARLGINRNTLHKKLKEHGLEK